MTLPPEINSSRWSFFRMRMESTFAGAAAGWAASRIDAARTARAASVPQAKVFSCFNDIERLCNPTSSGNVNPRPRLQGPGLIWNPAESWLDFYDFPG